ncbi:MAG: rRNA processing protein RimM [Solirubrobacteraceae bacterium]|jgi:16S rRNA processing protein RimM|nr:rRNA processing protein RimM [Solirubrobacteraceae bacterium]
MAGDGLRAGRVGRPHGLDGSFYVTRPRPSLLELGTSVRVAGRETRIVRRAGTDARPIVRVEGCGDRESAQALRDVDLWVEAAEAPALPEGEWWAEELTGCRVVDGERRVGVVRGMLGLPSCECLEVERPDGTELLVPMVGDAVRRVDVVAGEIEINLAFLGEAG